MIIKDRYIITTILVLASSLAGQPVFSALDIPVSIRSLSLTNGAGAVPTDILNGNPAVMEFDGRSVGVHFFSYPAGITGQGIHYTTQSVAGVVSANLTVMNFGRFSDSATGEAFSAEDIIFRAGFKSVFAHRLSWGISAGGIRSQIGSYRALGIFMNAGVRSRLLDDRMGIGLSLENAGKMISTYSGFDEPVKGVIRYSIFYHPLHLPAVLSVDYQYSSMGDPLLIFAGEFSMNRGSTVWVSTSSEKQNLAWGEAFHALTAGMAGGIRIPVKKYMVDIGYQNLGAAGNVLGFGISKVWR